MRVIVLVEEIDPAYGRAAWYVGVVGFVLFFVYKFKLLGDRARIIRKRDLYQKLSSGKNLSGEEYRLLSEMVCAQDNWKERMNFFVIFFLSAISLVFALYIDLIK